MKELDLSSLKKMFLRAFERVEKEKEEINKINVFPVPDQDTGTNLAKTLFGIKEAVEKKEFKEPKELIEASIEGALNYAQGNIGVIFTGFLLGFLKTFNKNPISAKELAQAFEEGANKAQKSILNPKEGTVLDVIQAVARVFKKEAQFKENILEIFKEAIEKAREAVLATREKMEILRKANVVDAGALGFLIVLEGYFEALSQKEFLLEKEELPSSKIKQFIQIISHRYEIVVLLEEVKISEEKVKEKLGKLGNSLDIVKAGDKMKIHIHTDYPEEVKKEIKKFGKIKTLREEDMSKEIVKEPSVNKISIGFVTEDASTLPQKIIERYQIELARVKFEWPEMEKLEGENIYQKIQKAYELKISTRPKTSQATPKDYFEAFKKQLQKFEKVLCVTISSQISGCYNSAIQAREMLKEEEKERVFVFDSYFAMGATALFVLRAIELTQEGVSLQEILETLENLKQKTQFYLAIADPQGLEFIGRITPSQGNWIRRMKKIKLHPLLKIEKGKLEKGGIVFAKDEVEALFKRFQKEKGKNKKIRAVINHANNIEAARRLKDLLKNSGVEVAFISEGPPIIGAVTGPGSLFLGWQVIE